MAASGAPSRTPRRGPAPIASFDHDVSDESSPETKQSFRLPEIVEDASSTGGGDALAPPAQRARSQSTPAAGGVGAVGAVGAGAAGALAAPAAPRIDISRASSSSHHDSRDSSPELALFAGAAPSAAEGLGFREDGALDLRSSTEELAFLEPAPAPPPAAPARRHSRKDSQGSEAALLAVSGRTSRLSSVGSQCSAHSALSGLSRVGRLSVASAASRSPSPHRMLLETSFCGPKPIETDPELCAAAVEERLLEMAKLSAATSPTAAAPSPPVDARDRREVRTEATVERPAPRQASARPAPVPSAPAPAAKPAPAPAPPASDPPAPAADDEKRQKETRNRVRAEERRARSRERREDPGESRTKSRSKDIIRIRLKPSEEYEDDDDDDATECAARGPAPEPGPGPRAARPTELAAEPGPAPRRPARDSRTPSPAGAVVSRKSSFCSLFKSRETIASPESPSNALRRKKSLNEGRSRSRSRDRSATPTSATKIKGSVLSLFKTPRKSATSPSPSSREGSPVVQAPRPAVPQPPRPTRGEKLKYYEDAKDGIIHIPLRTPPDEAGAPSGDHDVRPASAPQQRGPPSSVVTSAAVPSSSAGSSVAAGPASTSVHAARSPSKPIQRTVLPDGSIIIPLRSPTEKNAEDDLLATFPVKSKTPEEPRPAEKTSRSSSTVEVVSAVISPGPVSTSSGPASASPGDAATGPSAPDVTPSPDPPPPAAPTERARSRRERLIFTTHVGSAEQVFCTQFSITKTPSVTSEISGSFPSFPDVEEPVAAASTSQVTSASTSTVALELHTPAAESHTPAVSPGPAPSPGGASPQDAGRDSSESEASSEAAPARAGNDVERRGLVVQESFEDELPYVPTTLPQERSLALPMVPVRERGGVRVAALQRPRAAAPRASPAPRVPPVPRAPAAPPSTPAPRAPAAEDKIRIKLPRRPRTASASAAPPRPERARSRSGSEGMETRSKAEWIDFEEVPEKRKQPKRIQTLPSAAVGAAGAAGAGAAARDVVFSYVAPDECRCECHARADDETPLLLDDAEPRLGMSPEDAEAGAGLARPFTADLQLRHEPATPQEPAGARP